MYKGMPAAQARDFFLKGLTPKIYIPQTAQYNKLSFTLKNKNPDG
jgi:hypothetical protein